MLLASVLRHMMVVIVPDLAQGALRHIASTHCHDVSQSDS